MKNNQLTEFSLRLKESGYPGKMRREIIERGMEMYEKQVEKENNGSCPLHRPKGYEKVQRTKKKRRGKTSWHKPYESVLFCQPTPKGELAKTLREIVRKQKIEGGMDIKVVERAGVKIGKLLPGLKAKGDCGREDCLIHTTGGKGDCNRENVVYEGRCLTCKDKGKDSVYIGESSRRAM